MSEVTVKMLVDAMRDDQREYAYILGYIESMFQEAIHIGGAKVQAYVNRHHTELLKMSKAA